MKNNYKTFEDCEWFFKQKNKYNYVEKSSFIRDNGEEINTFFWFTCAMVAEGLPTLGIHDYLQLSDEEKKNYHITNQTGFAIEEDTFDKIVSQYKLMPFSKEDIENSKIKGLGIVIMCPDDTLLYTYENLK